MPYAFMGLTSLLLFVMSTTVPDVRLAVIGFVFSTFWGITFAIGLRKKSDE